jgi:hypothetical protein
MHFRAFRNLSFFYFTWISAFFVVPVALLCLYAGILWPAGLLLAYYSYRAVCPAARWDWMRLAL